MSGGASGGGFAFKSFVRGSAPAVNPAVGGAASGLYYPPPAALPSAAPLPAPAAGTAMLPPPSGGLYQPAPTAFADSSGVRSSPPAAHAATSVGGALSSSAGTSGRSGGTWSDPSLPLHHVRTLRGHSASVQVVRWNTDGSYALSGGQDKAILLWNPARDPPEDEAITGGLMVQEFSGHGYEVLDIAVAPSHTNFVSVGGDRCAFVWDVPTAKAVRRLFGHEQRIACVTLSEDASVMVTGSDDKTVRVWDMKSHARGAMQALCDARDNVTHVSVYKFSIVTASMDGHVRAYDLRMGRMTDDALGGGIAAAAPTIDQQCMLVSQPRAGPAPRLVLHDLAAGAALNTYVGHTNSSFRLQPCVASSDAVILSGSEDGGVHFWDIVDAAKHATLPAHSKAVSCVAYHPRAGVNVMATASFDSTIKIWASAADEGRMHIPSYA